MLTRGARAKRACGYLFAGTALFAVTASAALAQEAESGEGGLAEIVVTAQKREQSLQDVPIAVTALTADTLTANRINTVGDLTGLAPGLTVRAAAGSTGLPSFTMRGMASTGVVPGADKEISIYLDGVYLSSSRASMFALPDIARIEVLRGPQGTLFGRNSTAGAISIITRDPTGEIGAVQSFSFGNYDQFRLRTTLDLPAVGPFSAYVSFLNDKRRGDVRNLGAGTRWDRTGPQTEVGVQFSPDYLGDKNLDSWFASVKFDPGAGFTAIYKFDRTVDHYTPEATGAILINPNYVTSANFPIGRYIAAVVNNQAVPYQLFPDGKRPKAVNNDFVTPGIQRTTGHNLTMNWQASDSLSFKSITAYRSAYVNSASQIGGLGGLTITPQAAAALVPVIGAGATALIGRRFSVTDTNAQAFSKQWSEELQANYSSDFIALTVGGIWFHSDDRSGGPRGIRNTFSVTAFPADGRIPLGGEATSYNKATSLAAYAQAEIHVTPQIDIVAGGRITNDKKSGSFVSGGTFVPTTPGSFTSGTFTGAVVSSFTYKKTKPSFALGVNYKPSNNTLLYAKYSTAFTSGGSIGGVNWDPETVGSWEAGVKTDLFDRRVRTNLALWYADYKDVQFATSGQNVNRPDLGTVLFNGIDSFKAWGAEFEATVLPADGLTLTSSVGYTDTSSQGVAAAILASAGSQGNKPSTGYIPRFREKWTVNLTANYETQPLVGDTRLDLRVDANWHSKSRGFNENPTIAQDIPGWIEYTPARWIVNARAALKDVAVGPAKVEIAAWAKNLFNDRSPTYMLNFLAYVESTTWEPARTYGVDLTMRF